MKSKCKIFIPLLIFLLTINSFASDLSAINFKVHAPKYGTGTGRVTEDKNVAHEIGAEHSVKYYAYQPSLETDEGDFIYYDAAGTYHKMFLDQDAYASDVVWDIENPISKKGSPLNYNVSIGIDVSKYNGKIDWDKVKNAGINFAIVRLVYRGYGKKGTLLEDQKGIENLINAKNAGLKIGAYIFSQAINIEETLEEAQFAIKLLNDNNITLDLPLVYDPETIRGAVARTDNVTSETFTNNAIAFSKYVLTQNMTPAIYANMIWEDYYFDMAKLREYDFWYADYYDFPFTPYKYKFWQFTEKGIVSGIDGYVDLNMMLEEHY